MAKDDPNNFRRRDVSESLTHVMMSALAFTTMRLPVLTQIELVLYENGFDASLTTPNSVF